MGARFPLLSLCPPLAAILLLSLVPAQAAEPEPTGVLTLAEAFRIVETENYTALLSREAVAQAVEAVRIAGATLLPQVTWDVAQRRSRTASVGGALVRSGINNRFDSTLNGRLDLLDPGNIASYRASRIGVQVAQLDAAQVMQDVYTAVAAAYFTHLRNRRRTEVIDSNIERARVLLSLSRNQLNAGVATQIDVTRAEAQLAAAEQSRLQQTTDVQASELALKQLLTYDLGRPLRLEEFAVRREPVGEPVAALEERAYAGRSDLRMEEERLRQYQMQTQAAKLGRLPSLSLIGSVGQASENALDGNESNVWSGTVALSLPVFDGRRLRSAYRLAQSAERAQDLQVKALRLQIGAEVHLATQDATSRREQIAAAEKSRSLAEDELRLARVRFEQGVADNREVVDAQNSLAVASDNLVEAIYRYDLSRLELARARGDVREILREQAAP